MIVPLPLIGPEMVFAVPFGAELSVNPALVTAPEIVMPAVVPSH